MFQVEGPSKNKYTNICSTQVYCILECSTKYNKPHPSSGTQKKGVVTIQAELAMMKYKRYVNIKYKLYNINLFSLKMSSSSWSPLSQSDS